jgi:hypothetical protein
VGAKDSERRDAIGHPTLLPILFFLLLLQNPEDIEEHTGIEQDPS